MGTPVRGGMRFDGWSVQTLSSFFLGFRVLRSRGLHVLLAADKVFNRNRLRAISSVVLSFSYFVVLLSTFLLSKASVASLVEVLFVFVGQIFGRALIFGLVASARLPVCPGKFEHLFSGDILIDTSIGGQPRRAL